MISRKKKSAHYSLVQSVIHSQSWEQSWGVLEKNCLAQFETPYVRSNLFAQSKKLSRNKKGQRRVGCRQSWRMQPPACISINPTMIAKRWRATAGTNVRINQFNTMWIMRRILTTSRVVRFTTILHVWHTREPYQVNADRSLKWGGVHTKFSIYSLL